MVSRSATVDVLLSSCRDTERRWGKNIIMTNSRNSTSGFAMPLLLGSARRGTSVSVRRAPRGMYRNSQKGSTELLPWASAKAPPRSSTWWHPGIIQITCTSPGELRAWERFYPSSMPWELAHHSTLCQGPSTCGVCHRTQLCTLRCSRPRWLHCTSRRPAD